jgi:hypothetical protein
LPTKGHLGAKLSMGQPHQRAQLGGEAKNKCSSATPIETDTIANLANVRIDIKDLIRLTSSYDGSHISVHISISTQKMHSETILHTIRVRMLAALAQIVEKYPTRLRAKNFALYVDGYGNARSMEVRQDGEDQIFQEPAFCKADDLVSAVLQYRVIDLSRKVIEYDGTLWCWARYLEEAVMPYNSEKAVWGIHSFYFGTALTGNWLGLPKNMLQRRPDYFGRPKSGKVYLCYK